MWNDFQKGLRLVSYCPLCHTQYLPMEASVLEERNDAHLIYAQCRTCNSSILALVYREEGGTCSVGLVTDLTKEEVMKYRNAEEITADDVIDVHQLLN